MPLIRRTKMSPEIPTGSMADIVFLLLVFFLVTTTMVQDKGIGMQLPPAANTTKVPPKNLCNVWINASGEIMIDMDKKISMVQLRALIEQRLRENDKLIVSLKADEEAKYETFIDALDEIKLSGAERISLASPE